jgi:predicted RNA-binding Zn-ribbon protein involved in translation (DUF1610 family)
MQTASQKKTGFYIGVTCPGCGGHLELDSDFFVLECTHCGSVLRLVMPDVPPAFLIRSKTDEREARFAIDRYLKENDLPLTGSSLAIKKLYYPYWKVDGILLKIRNRVEQRSYGGGPDYSGEGSTPETVVDIPISDISIAPYMTTYQAGPALEGIDVSIGMRAGHVTALPYSEDTVEDDFDSIPVTQNSQAVLARAGKAASRLSNIALADFGSNHTELLNPSISIVYFPYLIVESYDSHPFRRFVVDAVSGRLVSPSGQYHPPAATQDDHDDREPDDASAANMEFGSVGVEFHRCRTCGEDLPSEQSFIYLCANCQEITVLERVGFDVTSLKLAAGESHPDDILLPFWFFRMPEENVRRMPNFFGGIHKSDWMAVPGFKVPNFEALYRLAKRMSAAQFHMQLETVDEWDRRCRPIDMSLTQAAAFAGVVLYRESASKGVRPGGEHPVVQPLEARVCYIPFHLESYFYVDSILNAVSVERALIK